MSKTVEEIREIVITTLRTQILEALFQYNFIPEDCKDDDYDMEIIKLYRGLFQEACTQPLFDMIDEKIQTKLKKFNK